MKYLITGITGFAGPHLANLLHKEGHEVYGLIRNTNGMENDIRDVVPDEVYKDIKFVQSDLTNYRALQNIIKENTFDGVFHLAAQSHPPSSFTDPLGTFNDNIMGSANLIQALADHQPECMMMFCSTSEVYGNLGKDRHKIQPDNNLLPANPYGASKAAIDLYMQERIINGKIRGFVTRAFSHTGPRRGKNFSISSDAFQIARMMRGYQDKVLKVGNLSTYRVVIDVRDVVNAYYLAMIHPDVNGKVFNVCGDTPYQMQMFTDILIGLGNVGDVKQEVSPDLYRPIDIDWQNGDSTNLREMTGWKLKYDIGWTLSDLLDYWYDKLK